MGLESRVNRRRFIQSAAVTSAALLAGTPLSSFAADEKKRKGVGEVSPVEELMREHGVLRRVLLVYEEALRRFDGGKQFDPALLKQSAGIIRDFINDYHEKLEEARVFPWLKAAGVHAKMVDVLVVQHRVGRKLTENIDAGSTTRHLGNPSDRRAVAGAMRDFIAMYRPHAAQEDTVIFPDLKKLLTAEDYKDLGERFKEKERELFGRGGFEAVVARVAGIERALGIDDLARSTPKG